MAISLGQISVRRDHLHLNCTVLANDQLILCRVVGVLVGPKYLLGYAEKNIILHPTTHAYSIKPTPIEYSNNDNEEDPDNQDISSYT